MFILYYFVSIDQYHKYTNLIKYQKIAESGCFMNSFKMSLNNKNKKQRLCKYSLRHSQEKPLHSMLNQLTQSTMSRLKSKIKKESPPINKDSSLQENNQKTEEHSQTITYRKNPLYTQC